MVNGDNAKEARTNCKVLKTGYYGKIPCTLVELSPITGRSHQLRVHMKHIGNPIIGDLTYYDGNEPVDATRMILHAWKIHMKAKPVWSKNSVKPHKGGLSRYLNQLRNLRNKIETNLSVQELNVSTTDPFTELIRDGPQVNDDDELSLIRTRKERFYWVKENVTYK